MESFIDRLGLLRGHVADRIEATTMSHEACRDLVKSYEEQFGQLIADHPDYTANDMMHFVEALNELVTLGRIIFERHGYYLVARSLLHRVQKLFNAVSFSRTYPDRLYGLADRCGMFKAKERVGEFRPVRFQYLLHPRIFVILDAEGLTRRWDPQWMDRCHYSRETDKQMRLIVGTIASAVTRLHLNGSNVSQKTLREIKTAWSQVARHPNLGSQGEVVMGILVELSGLESRVIRERDENSATRQWTGFMKEVIYDTFSFDPVNPYFTIEISKALDWAMDTFTRPLDFRFEHNDQQIVIAGAQGEVQTLDVGPDRVRLFKWRLDHLDFIHRSRAIQLSRFSRRPTDTQVQEILKLNFEMELPETEMTVGMTYLSESGPPLTGKKMLKKASRHKRLGHDHAKAVLERAEQIPTCLQGAILVFPRLEEDQPGGRFYVSCLVYKDNAWKMVRRLVPSDWRACAIIHPV